MTKAKVFQSDNKQAERLRKASRFKANVVEISKRSDEIIVLEKLYTPDDALAIFAKFPADFMQLG